MYSTIIDINPLIYGVTLKISCDQLKSENAQLFISPHDNRMLQILDNSKSYHFLVDLTQVVEISDQQELKLEIKNTSGNILKIYCNDFIEQECLKKGFTQLIAQAKYYQDYYDDENEIWSRALKLLTISDTDMNQQISFQELQFMIGELQINLSERKTLKVFELHQTNGYVTYDSFYKMLMDLMVEKELYPIYQKYCSLQEGMFENAYSARLMTHDDIIRFFLKEQGEAYKPRRSHYNFYEFSNIIFNIKNTIFQKKPVDESHTLASYLINSSHNTYLEANQLTGESSQQAYIDAFRLGAKCVELDCWDGNDGEPVVTHGHTLVNNILFSDVIKTVRDYGFILDDYPVILSLEMHCKNKQQQKIAQHLKEILKDQLLLIEDFHRLNLPTLLETKRKVLVKNKGDKHYMSDLASHHLTKSKSNELIQFEEDEDEDDVSFHQTISQNEKNDKEQEQKKESKITKQLMEVTSLFALPLNLESERESVWTISSVEERVIKQLIEKKHVQVQEFAKKYFLRIYPLGLRFDSSNYDPMPSWCVGAQMVALNIQTKDKWMLINQGRFLNSTYVLKEKDQNISKLTISVISAINLTWEDSKRRQEEVVDPYIKVRIAGHHEDEKNSKKWKTQSIKDNGYHPVFNFNCQIVLHHANQAVIYFQAFSYSLLGDTLLSQYALPVSHLKKGFRVIPMMNSQFQLIQNCYVLVHIKIE